MEHCHGAQLIHVRTSDLSNKFVHESLFHLQIVPVFSWSHRCNLPQGRVSNLTLNKLSVYAMLTFQMLSLIRLESFTSLFHTLIHLTRYNSGWPSGNDDTGAMYIMYGSYENQWQRDILTFFNIIPSHRKNRTWTFLGFSTLSATNLPPPSFGLM